MMHALHCGCAMIVSIPTQGCVKMSTLWVGLKVHVIKLLLARNSLALNGRLISDVSGDGQCSHSTLGHLWL